MSHRLSWIRVEYSELTIINTLMQLTPVDRLDPLHFFRSPLLKCVQFRLRLRIGFGARGFDFGLPFERGG